MMPVRLKINEKGNLFVKWDDSSETEIEPTHLRRYCPCAVCASMEENHHHDSIKVFTDSQVKIKDLKLVGNYALSISWGDSHSTGIYDFSYLKKISQL